MFFTGEIKSELKLKQIPFTLVEVIEEKTMETYMKHFYQNLQGWFDFQDIYTEQVQRAKDGAHFVEIGAWMGKSTAYMAVEIYNSQKDIRFDVIDTWAGSPTESQQKVIREGVDVYAKFLENLDPVIDIINPIKSNSVQASLQYEDESLDFVFIDGNHLYQAVKYDIQSYLPKVKKGGVLAGHDWRAHPEVQRAVREFFTDKQIQIKHRSWYVQL